MDLTKGRLEEHLAKRALPPNEQNEPLQAIAENVPGVVFQFYSRGDRESGVRYTSPMLYEIFGLEFIDDPPVLLKTFIENIHEEDRQSFIDSIQEVSEKQIPWSWKGRYVKPSGKIIWFEGLSSPIVRKDEVVFNGLLLDITEQKKAKKVLRKTHKLNNPSDENNQKNRKEEILGSFTVINEANELKQVIVSQDIVTHYSKEESYPKHFRLESLYGVAVYQTEDPDIFQLVNGTILKRKKGEN